MSDKPTYSGIQNNVANGGSGPGPNAPAWQHVAASGAGK